MAELELFSEGMTANEAIAAVRRKRSGAIETYEQEDILFAFEAMLTSDI